MLKKKLVGIAVAATVTIFCSVKAEAESSASFQAGSSAGAMNDSQANGENSSQATSRNSSQSVSEQNSHAASQNTSAGGAEVIGGPLTNSRPGNGNMPGNSASNTSTSNQNGANHNVINGGSGYFSPQNTGSLPAPPQDTPPIQSRNASPDPTKRDVGVAVNQKQQLSHVPVPVVKTYRWSGHKRSTVRQSNSRLIGSRTR
jgi:hypothetical protein